MQPVIADHHSISLASELLSQGRLVAFPTETVYGLGADASNAAAVAGIFKAKGRPANHPLIVHIGRVNDLEQWACHIPDAALKLAEQFWPGPLAMILAKQPAVPSAVTGGQQTVGLRMPNHPVALALLQEFGGGIAAPSANRFCRISPTQAVHVAEELGDAVDLILDGGACEVGVESTIIDLSTRQPRLLRPGRISVAELNAVLNLEVLLPPAPGSAEIRAPGMMAVHYAPRTLALRYPAAQLPAQLQLLTAQGKNIGLLSYGFSGSQMPRLTQIGLPQQPEGYAQGLYAALRQLDNSGLDLILIEQPPETSAWQAVNDRLGKAASAA